MTDPTASAQTDPYDALGVDKTASPAEIKAAYRKRARENHPDLKPGDPAAEERFKAANAAYDLLKDPDQRRRFDAGEIDASGQVRAQPRYYRDFAEAADNPYRPGSAHYGEGGGAGFDASDLYQDLFGKGQRRQGGARHAGFDSAGFSAPGPDAHFALTVPFLTAANGGRAEIQRPDGQAMAVTIPAGARVGQILRLKGKGAPGFGDGPPGDLYLTLDIAPHQSFRREGQDIHSDVDVPVDVAVLGGAAEVETVSGKVRVKVPAWTTSGTVLRLRGKGAGGRGDHLAHLVIALPPRPNDLLKELFEDWRVKGGDG